MSSSDALSVFSKGLENHPVNCSKSLNMSGRTKLNSDQSSANIKENKMSEGEKRGRKKGRKGGRKRGREKGRRKEGREEGREEGRKGGRKGGREERREEVRM